MNWRVDLRLLRPARVPILAGITLITVLLVLAACGLAWAHAALFIACIVHLPLLLGAGIATPLHATMHRPFFALLPGGLRRMRRMAVASYTLLAVLGTLAACGIEAAAPAPAVFGLAIGLLTLACANRRQGGLPDGQRSLLNVMAGPVTGAGTSLGLLFATSVAPRLLAAMQAAPVLFLVAGTGSAATTIALGFSRRMQRERAMTPYFATTAITWTTPIFLWKPQEQLGPEARHGTCGPGPGRESRGDAVGPRLRDWLRVLDYQRPTSFGRIQIRALFTMVFFVSGCTVACGALGILSPHRPGHPAGILTTLANLTADTLARSDEFFPTLTMIGVIVIMFIIVLIPLGFSRPLLAYPLARARLAQVVFAHTGRHMLASLLVSIAAFWTCSLIGQLATGRPNPLLGLPAVARLGLTLAPLLPLLALKAYADRSAALNLAARVPGYVVSLGVALAVTATLHEWRDCLLAPAGILTSAVVTTIAAGLLRRRIARHYRSCDLTQETPFPLPAGTPVTAGRRLAFPT